MSNIIKDKKVALFLETLETKIQQEIDIQLPEAIEEVYRKVFEITYNEEILKHDSSGSA